MDSGYGFLQSTKDESKSYIVHLSGTSIEGVVKNEDGCQMERSYSMKSHSALNIQIV